MSRNDLRKIFLTIVYVVSCGSAMFIVGLEKDLKCQKFGMIVFLANITGMIALAFMHDISKEEIRDQEANQRINYCNWLNTNCIATTERLEGEVRTLQEKLATIENSRMNQRSTPDEISDRFSRIIG